MTLYETLEVDPTADRNTIRASYKRLCQKYHPDKQTGDAEKFEQVRHAYQVLEDPERRARYDADGDDSPANQVNPAEQVILKVFTVIVGVALNRNQKVLQSGLMAMLEMSDGNPKPFIDDARFRIRERQKELTTGLGIIDKNTAKLERMIGKTKRSDKEHANLFEGIVKQKIQQCEAQRESLQSERTINADALNMLEEYTDTEMQVWLDESSEVTNEAFESAHRKGAIEQQPFYTKFNIPPRHW